MEKAEYLVRFTACEHSPNFEDLKNCSLKLGTFQHFRKIENESRKDEVEGQSGLFLKVKKPCSLLQNEVDSKNLNLELNEKGEFRNNLYLDISNHSNEFNTWIFCVSAINDLNEIENLKKRFGCACFYFIKDYKKFENAIQKSLAENLILKPLNEKGEYRVKKDNTDLYILSGKRKMIKYANIAKYMRQECETLTDFYKSQDSLQVNSDLWFYKPEKYKIEKELRFIFYAVADSNHDKFFQIIDDSIILNCDLTDAISLFPTKLE